MAFQFHVSPPDQYLERLLPGLRLKGIRALWIKPLRGNNFDVEDVRLLLHGFSVLQGVLWRLSPASSGRSRKIMEYQRAFAGWPSLAQKFYLKGTFEELGLKETP